MRQLVSFVEAIRKRNTTNEYHRIAVHVKLAGGEMPTLESVLGVGSEEPIIDAENFDLAAAKLLEKMKRDGARRTSNKN
jgi:hypothetical protein